MGTKREYKLDKEYNQKLRKIKTTDNEQIKNFFMSMPKNIVTPEFIRVGTRKSGKFIYEVTSGTDMKGKLIFGLCVYRWNIDDAEYERVSQDGLTGVHYSEKAVEKAVASLGEM